MSEFLQNLRAKQNKRFDGNRRQYPNPQYQDRRNGKDNRKQQQAVATAVETLSATLVENLPIIKTILEGMSENQKMLAEAEYRRARAEEHKAALMENIFEYAKQWLCSNPDFSGIEAIKTKIEVPGDMNTPMEVENLGTESENFIAQPQELQENVDLQSQSHETPENIDSQTPSREEVLTKIYNLRDNGLTYDQIAKQLETEEIPTFSRKGRWRGQTVHRLYQKMTS